MLCIFNCNINREIGKSNKTRYYLSTSQKSSCYDLPNFFVGKVWKIKSHQKNK